MHHQQFGIYLNPKEKKVVRINSPYWIPSGPEWVLLTSEVNTTLVAIRQLAGEKKLVARAQEITWGEIPHRPEQS